MVLGLLLSPNVLADTIFNYINFGMTKSELQDTFLKYTSNFYQSDELKNTKAGAPLCYIGAKTGNLYFKSFNSEITTHAALKDDEGVWYVFENVTKPIKSKLGGLSCKLGNGTLKAVTSTRQSAINLAKSKTYVDSSNFVKFYKPKISKIVSTNTSSNNSNNLSTDDKISKSKQICTELGFKANSEKFADCALKMMALQFETGSKVSNNDGSSTQQIIVKQQDDFDIGDFFFGLQKIVDDNYRSTNNSSNQGTNCRIVPKAWGADMVCR